MFGRKLGVGLAVVIVLALFLLVNRLQGAVIEADWQTSGDNLAFYDTENNLEWLDFERATYEDGTKSVNAMITELETGGVFEGWRYASNAEFHAMLRSAGFTDFGTANTANVNPAINLFSVSGGHIEIAGRYYRTWAYTSDWATAGTIRDARLFGLANLLYNADDPLTAGVDINYIPPKWDVNTGRQFMSHALVRSVVPEPTSLAMWAGLGVMGLIAVRRRKRTA